MGSMGNVGNVGTAGKSYSGGITTEEEKNHVIKVLEHESKVYRFEKNLVETFAGEERFDQRSEQGGYKSTRIRDFWNLKYIFNIKRKCIEINCSLNSWWIGS